MVDRVASDQLRVDKAQVQAINKAARAIQDLAMTLRSTNAILAEYSRTANEDDKEQD